VIQPAIQPAQPGVPAASIQPHDLHPLDVRLRDAIHLVKAEYLEMPGLGLTLPQVARFFALSLEESEQLVAALVGEGVLVCDERGAYRRRW
jgi:hypothetical protein